MKILFTTAALVFAVSFVASTVKCTAQSVGSYELMAGFTSGSSAGQFVYGVATVSSNGRIAASTRPVVGQRQRRSGYKQSGNRFVIGEYWGAWNRVRQDGAYGYFLNRRESGILGIIRQ
jgi:hypothetical protein